MLDEFFTSSAMFLTSWSVSFTSSLTFCTSSSTLRKLWPMSRFMVVRQRSSCAASSWWSWMYSVILPASGAIFSTNVVFSTSGVSSPRVTSSELTEPEKLHEPVEKFHEPVEERALLAVSTAKASAAAVVARSNAVGDR